MQPLPPQPPTPLYPYGTGPGAPEDPSARNARLAVAAFVAVMGVGCLMYRLLVVKRLEQTSALFVGIPTVLGVLLALVPTKSALAVIMKGITLALLLSGVLLGEGVICILMASPLFYVVGLVAGLLVDWARKSQDRYRALAVGLPVLLLMSLEGVSPALSFDRAETIVAERELSASASDVAGALGATPRIDAPLPLVLKIFPHPIAASGSGLALGNRRVVHFDARTEGAPGDLTLEVVESAPGRVRFQAISDESHIPHWLDWQDGLAEWEEIAPGRTRVRFTVRYRRGLDPAWYFRPIQRYVVGLASEQLIDMAATPAP